MEQEEILELRGVPQLLNSLFQYQDQLKIVELEESTRGESTSLVLALYNKL